MAEEQHEVRNINWNEVFSFTHIFKSFRMAIHPSKLILAFAAIAVIFVTGCVLDWFWALGGGYVYTEGAVTARGEISNHFIQRPDEFGEGKEKWQEGRLEAAAGVLAEWQKERKELRSESFPRSTFGGLSRPSRKTTTTKTSKRRTSSPSRKRTSSRKPKERRTGATC